jgi:hypothetical protein
MITLNNAAYLNITAYIIEGDTRVIGKIENVASDKLCRFQINRLNYRRKSKITLQVPCETAD